VVPGSAQDESTGCPILEGGLELFDYGSLLAGERDHDLLAGAEFLGAARTKPLYTLVDLGPYPALFAGGNVSVLGELYRIDKKRRFQIDVRKECPVLFQRVKVELEDGRLVEAYAMREEQVRGRRRIKSGSFRDRFRLSR
jgi:gamma-glutamylcyclotransferase (GGCT)/AIG2-like uncharacterized protein YtfP